MKVDKIKRNKGNPLSCIRTVIRRGEGSCCPRTVGKCEKVNQVKCGSGKELQTQGGDW